MNCIVAVDNNWAIGYKNNLLVSIPADMRFFRDKSYRERKCYTIINNNKTDTFGDNEYGSSTKHQDIYIQFFP